MYRGIGFHLIILAITASSSCLTYANHGEQNTWAHLSYAAAVDSPVQIYPAAEQYGLKLTTNAQGQLEIDNQSQLYTDYRLVRVYDQNILRIESYSAYGSSILDPAEHHQQELDFVRADLRFYSAGLADISDWSSYQQSLSYTLALRQLIEAFLLPSISEGIGISIFTHEQAHIQSQLRVDHAFDDLPLYWFTEEKISAAAVLEGWISVIDHLLTDPQIIKDILRYLLEPHPNFSEEMLEERCLSLRNQLMVKKIFYEMLINEGMQGVSWAEQISRRMASTPQQIDFRVAFPTTVDRVLPAAIKVVDGVVADQQFVLSGHNLTPLSSCHQLKSCLPRMTLLAENGAAFLAEDLEVFHAGSRLGFRLAGKDLQLAADGSQFLAIQQLGYYPVADQPFVYDVQPPQALYPNLKIDVVDHPLISALIPDSAVWGETITMEGIGFAKREGLNQVYFPNTAGQYTRVDVSGNFTEDDGSSLQVQVPKGATSGPVYLIVEEAGSKQQSNKDQAFTLDGAIYDFTYGDSGYVKEGIYNFYFNGTLLSSMATPQQTPIVSQNLRPGDHQITLKATHLNDYGNYFLTLPPLGVTLSDYDPVTGAPSDALTGPDLILGNEKTFYIHIHPIDVQGSSEKSLK